MKTSDSKGGIAHWAAASLAHGFLEIQMGNAVRRTQWQLATVSPLPLGNHEKVFRILITQNGLSR
jgi:hypothetical protein